MTAAIAPIELLPGVVVHGALDDARRAILAPDAVAFVADLVRAFRPRIDERLAARRERHARLLAGERLRFLPETASIRAGAWRCAPLPADLLDRRVEITGPVDRKMIINALNSGASVFMADFEDANAPTWANCIDGQVNLFDAVRRTIEFTADTGKRYALGEKVATLFVRPRGFHLEEKHFEVDGRPAPGMLFDFGLYFFHNARELLARGSGPYFYLPKMESHLEARVWNDVFVRAQSALGLPVGTIKATCLVETLPAAFEMDEILFELREHSAGLNCGRWDYIFSYIKTHATDPSRVLPDRGQVTMTQPFMRAYTRLVIKTCHRRGVSAMGGMAAQIPIKGDEAANQAALDKVRADKLREVQDGHDGTWVAHPALVPVAREVFDAHMKTPNQIDSGKQADFEANAEDLLAPPEGPRTLAAMRHNARVGVQYIEAWLRGTGAVALYDLMEDAATAEISRSQIWQWIAHRTPLATPDGGTVVATPELLRTVLEEELAVVAREVGESAFRGGRFEEARAIFFEVATKQPLADFLTLPAYEALRSLERAA
jgi:malate synthase